MRKLLSTLRGRLFALLAALGAVTALAVAGATYVSVRAEADQLFDYQLRQTALSLRDQGRIAPDEAASLADPSLDYVVQIWSVQGLELYSSRPQGMTEPLPPRAVLGFSHQRLGGQDWRVFSAATPLRVVQVAQPLAVRQKLAAVAALRSVVPVAVALPLVAAAVWWLIGVSLAPLARVTQAAQAGGANALDALPTDGLPGEVAPLVEAFNGLLARLAAAFDAQRGFVADAAHELRSPLTALKLQLGLLRGAAPGEEQDTAIARLNGGISRAAHLVEQLLALARAEPGAPAADLPLDLSELARQAVADVQPLADKAGVTIALTAPDPLPLEGDPQALRGALRNLVDNAVKYGARTVQVSALRGPQGARLLRVDDDGPGIPPDARERVFDRFQRGEDVSAVEGSGLGLAIVRAAAARQGAHVQLGTAPLGGLRAEIRWPG
ncbi:ATP-binding protein [Roseateles asaccharophilus]|uniref:histidine kinase n=1 Tax=Roseateles asaccharophilus TaxID=582607 RepID=A0ABU2A739_9BURK|nr:ATP-binding protein [Roseateles asaccharophilus]MDR7332825.1 two-component system OmpR family sensor kinase/two-component system sensor histidine kinase QseC [Roseateles asaccharophilus]